MALIKEVSKSKVKLPYGTYYYGRISTLPPELIGKRVVILVYEEFEEKSKDILRLKLIKQFCEYVLNSKNYSKMFNIVSKTWNPVTGCLHYCTYCWARKLALTKLKNHERYREGFIPRLNRREFTKKFDKGLVFVTDMGDLFGDFIPSDWIVKVINYIRKFPKTLFLFLTKNPERYFEFLDIMPQNAILGATIETNRDSIYLEHYISRAPLPSRRYEAMRKLKWDKKFISIEPILDFDLEIFVKWIKEINPIIVYIGYDNYNNKLPEPPLKKTLKLIKTLSEFTLTIRKTIRPAWYEGLRKYVS